LVNYFIQSTAADVALFGFTKIIERLISTKTNEFIKPILLLHDALILDVRKDAQFILPKLAKLGGNKIPKFENMHFWIEIEKL
jgi:DNA polymerase I-like protein with 3'-5' exonuclease and polymerase domains